VDNLLGELNAIIKAVNVKRHLQKHNLVAIQELDSDKGQLIIKIVKLFDGLNIVESNKGKSNLNLVNTAAVVAGLEQDGYDIYINK
jgi:hypothetical protein